MVIGLGILSVIGLYFFGNTLPTQTKQAVETNAASDHETHNASIDITAFQNDAEKLLETTERDKWLELKSGNDHLAQAEFWSSIDRNDVAATFKKQHAVSVNDYSAWNSTGDLYVRAFRESADSSYSMYFLNESIYAYNKALEVEDNAETKLKLAKIHTELTGQVMQGVSLLRQILEENPNHVQANYELGLLSIRSGQNDKALERFSRLIEIKPDFIEPYLLKSQLLLEQSDQKGAVATIDAAIQHANAEEKASLEQIRNNIINNN